MILSLTTIYTKAPGVGLEPTSSCEHQLTHRFFMILISRLTPFRESCISYLAWVPGNRFNIDNPYNSINIEPLTNYKHQKLYNDKHNSIAVYVINNRNKVSLSKSNENTNFNRSSNNE